MPHVADAADGAVISRRETTRQRRLVSASVRRSIFRHHRDLPISDLTIWTRTGRAPRAGRALVPCAADGRGPRTGLRVPPCGAARCACSPLTVRLRVQAAACAEPLQCSPASGSAAAPPAPRAATRVRPCVSAGVTRYGACKTKKQNFRRVLINPFPVVIVLRTIRPTSAFRRSADRLPVPTKDRAAYRSLV